MIELRHNGQSRCLDPGAYSDVGELVRDCARESGDPPRAVVRLRIDGREIPLDDLAALATIRFEGITQVELETRPLSEVALESLESSASYTRAIDEALHRTASLLREGRVEQANRLFACVVDGLTVLIFAVSSAGKTLRSGAEELGELEPQVRPWLEAISEAQEERDWLRVADYLEYELQPRLAEWPARLGEVRGRFQASASPKASD